MTPVACPTSSLFTAVRAELAPLLERRQVRIETQIDPRATTVIADSAKLHDALKNLVENAAHYAPEGSQVILSATSGEEGVVLSVEDEGRGLPESDLVRVFERFYRVEQSRARDSGGTGLGLAIVKHLVGLHGGAVTARKPPSGGSGLQHHPAPRVLGRTEFRQGPRRFDGARVGRSAIARFPRRCSQGAASSRLIPEGT